MQISWLRVDRFLAACGRIVRVLRRRRRPRRQGPPPPDKIYPIF